VMLRTRRYWTWRNISVRGGTSSSAVAERTRDASCPSLVSLNRIITRAESFVVVILLRLQIYDCVTLSAA